jgi:Carboxypeptidase regulatory-like domain
MQGLRAPIGGWWLKSLSLGGRELLDSPLDLKQGANDVVVTFSDRATELKGTIAGTPDHPPSDYVVIAFGVDKAVWFLNSRRVAGVRPDAEGRYSIRNLPPGDYLVAVTDDVEQNEWFDPAVLQRLAPSAMRITLEENETRTIDFKAHPAGKAF